MRDYLEKLRRAGQVREITREVSGKHELAAVTQASQRESEAPLLFHKVAGSRFPVMTAKSRRTSSWVRKVTSGEDVAS